MNNPIENPSITRLKELLDQKGWSLHKLSKEADMPYSSLCNLFSRNTEPTLPTLRAICKGLNVSVQEFLSDEPIPERFDITLEEKDIVIEYRGLRRNDKRLLRTYLAGLGKRLPEEQDED